MSKRDRDLDDEIRSHLRMAAEDRGNDDARREFGNVTLIKEVTREMWRYAAFDHLVQDVRFAVRMMGRKPAHDVRAFSSLSAGSVRRVHGS